jgi:hypothetical protein
VNAREAKRAVCGVVADLLNTWDAGDVAAAATELGYWPNPHDDKQRRLNEAMDELWREMRRRAGERPERMGREEIPGQAALL